MSKWIKRALLFIPAGLLLLAYWILESFGGAR